MEAVVKSIGHIETPYKDIDECPRNIESNGSLCSLVIKKELLDGLLGLSAGQKLVSEPKGNPANHGVQKDCSYPKRYMA